MSDARAIPAAFDKGKGVLLRDSRHERPSRSPPPPDEGMSYAAPADPRGKRLLFMDAVDELGASLIGAALKKEYGTWPMYSKFFDFNVPLFHHLHLDFESAKKVGRIGKPEAHFFPPQLNNHLGTFPATYFGFDPGVTKAQLRERLLAFEKGDNRITELSRACRIELGTGWYTPPGVVHVPGSVLTYEPQWNSDVNSVQENIAAGEVYPYEFLVGNVPDDGKRYIDYVMSLMDWDNNIDPDYRTHYFRPPVPCSTRDDGFRESWVVYANPYVAAKELTVLPGRSVTVRNASPEHSRFGP